MVGIMALSESFFWASCSWWSEGFFGQSFSIALPIQALKGIPWLGSFSVFWQVRHIERPPWLGSYSIDWHMRHHPWVGSYSLVQCASMLACGEREAMVMGPPPMCDSAVLPCFHDCLAFPTGTSHHDLLLHIPLIRLSAVNSSPRTGIASQSPKSSSQPLPLPGDPRSCPAYVWLWQGLSDSHSS